MIFNPENFKLILSKDYNAFDLGFNGSGVYIAYGLINSKSLFQQIYIGSAVDLRDRIIYEHIAVMNMDNFRKDTNKLLFRYCKKYGMSNINWYILEECNKDDTLIIEQKYLDLYRPFADERGGFNLTHFATAPTKGIKLSAEHKRKIGDANRGKMTGIKRNPAIGKKISESNKGEKHWIFGKNHTEESRLKMSISHTGHIGRKQTPEEIERRKLKKRKVYKFINPDGVKIEINNLKEFCSTNNLCQSSFFRLIKGICKKYKGWTYDQLDDSHLFKFISPSGEIIKVRSIKKLCDEFNLSRYAMLRVKDGKSVSYKGWAKAY